MDVVEVPKPLSLLLLLLRVCLTCCFRFQQTRSPLAEKLSIASVNDVVEFSQTRIVVFHYSSPKSITMVVDVLSDFAVAVWHDAFAKSIVSLIAK